MSDRRLGAIFCDDIRSEVGNKTSFMGVFEEELLVGKLPAILARFCAAVTVTTPIERPFTKLRMFVKLNDDVVFDHTMASSDLHAAIERARERAAAATEDSRMEFAVHINLIMSPLVLPRASTLQVFAETEVEGEVLKSRKLFIKARDGAAPDAKLAAEVDAMLRSAKQLPKRARRAAKSTAK